MASIPHAKSIQQSNKIVFIKNEKTMFICENTGLPGAGVLFHLSY